LPVLNKLSAWQRRLVSAAFRQPPWHDRDPARLAIEHDLPHDSLHLARIIDQFVDRLCLAALVASYRGRGSTPYRPDLMLKAVLFLTQRGIHSPAAWKQQCRENRVVQWLLRGCRPSRARWFAFRKRLVGFIDDVNKQFLAQARQEELLDVQVPILDGTLLAANSSRHKLLNKDTLDRRLTQLEQAISADGAAPRVASGGTVVATAKAPGPVASEPPSLSSDARAATVDGLGHAEAEASRPCLGALAPAEAIATASSPAPPAAPASSPAARAAAVAAANGNSATPPAWLAKTAKGRVLQQQRYLKAQQELHQRLEHNAKRRKEDRKAVEQVRISLGDAEATLGYDKEKVYRPLFNVQLVSDLKTDFCLAYGVFSGVQDAATLKPMLGRIAYFLDEKIKRLMTDAGYAQGATLRLLEVEQVELIAPWQENDWGKDKKAKKKIPKSAFIWDEQKQTYRCPEGHELKYVRTQTKKRGDIEEKHQQYRCPAEHCQNCPRQEECTKNARAGRMVVRNEYEAEVQRHRQRMQGEEAKELYKKRKEQIERRLADSKEHRDLRKLSMRGLAGAKVQVGLSVLANNMVIFDKLERTRQHGRNASGKVGTGYSEQGVGASAPLGGSRDLPSSSKSRKPLLGGVAYGNRLRSQFPYLAPEIRLPLSGSRGVRPCWLRL
jgi:transposase